MIPSVNTLWKFSCTARLVACSPLSKPKAETSMSLLGPGRQRMEQKRCSRFLSTTERDRDVVQVVPACLGTGQQQLQLQCIPFLTGNYSCCLSLLTLPSFPTPSTSALSFSVINRIEVEMSS